MDAAGDVFVADYGNNAVKEVLPDGTIKTIGSGFNGPYGVAVDAAGDVFVADTGNNACHSVGDSVANHIAQCKCFATRFCNSEILRNPAAVLTLHNLRLLRHFHLDCR